MSISPSLNELSKLALVASDASYFSTDHPVAEGSALAPLDEGDPTVIPRFDFQAGFIARKQFVDPPGVSTGFKAIAYERTTPGNPTEVILAFGGSDGGPLSNPTDWVSNTQHLGWNQWNANRDRIFQYLNDLPADTKITFTGQSLGGALAQYAAYEWVRSKTTPGLETYDSTFDKSRINLITFNAFGGYLALNDPDKGGGYSSSVLAGINADLSAHYVITGDMVSRLGGDPTTGIGHVGGPMYLLDYRTVNPDTAELVTLDLVEGHRIETGFYAGLSAGDAFTVATPLFLDQTPQQWYFQMSSLQNTAGLLGNILNGRDVSRAESYPRLLAGLMAGMTFGNPQEWDTLMKAYLTNLHDAGKLSDQKYALYHAATLPATVAGKPATAAIYTASVILAGLADALGLGLEAIQLGFSMLKTFLQVSTGPAEPTTISQEEFSQKAMLVLAATGALGNTHPLRQEFLTHHLNPDEFAQALLNASGSTWRNTALTYLADQLPNLSEKAQLLGLTVAFYDTLNQAPGLSPADLTALVQERDIAIRDTGAGFANALSDFTQKIADVAFHLEQVITSLGDIRLIDQAWASELNDPRLPSSARAAIEDARDTFRQAAQAVVIQTDMGPNPFHMPGFVPGGPLTATVEEQLGETFRLSLPFAVGVGGQHIALHFQGPQANQLSVVTNDGVHAVDAGGTVAVVVPEGADQLWFTLVASNEISADATVTLSATLVDLNGNATHTTQMESTINVKAYVEPTDGRYHTVVEDWSWITDPTVGVAMGSGGLVHQTLIGGAGSDVGISFPNGFGDDTLYGNGGNDFLYAERGHDVLYGGTGNDTLVGDNIDDHIDTPWIEIDPGDPFPDPRGTQDGKDFLDGGEGNDVLAGGGSNDRLIGGLGDDVLWGDAYTNGTRIQENPDGSYIIQYITGVLHPGDDVLEGGEGNDVLSGDGGDDALDGGTGDDILIGDTELSVNATLLYPTTPGNDFLTGGDGRDQLFGNAGSDVLLGGSGNDVLAGDDDGVDSSQEGNDWLEGGDGEDVLLGRGGNDTLIGDGGADFLYGGTGDDALDGGDGDDVGFGGTGDDTILGGAGADQFDGEAGDDVLFGGDGNDLLIGGEGLDQLDGGAGDDQLSGGEDTDTIVGGAGNDEIQGGLGDDLLVADLGDDRIFGQEGDDQLFGDEGNDGLRGDDGNDQLDGGAGDDILVGDADGQIGGSGGNDILLGGTGNDTLVGGGGEDTYLVDVGDGFDLIIEASGESNRLVFGAGISSDAIVATVGPNDSLVLRIGNGEQAVQIQNFGTNNLNGAHPIDSFGFSNGVVLTYAQIATAGLGTSGGVGNDQLTGTAQGDRVYGGAGSDTIEGLDGADTLFGDDGSDVLIGGSDNDVLSGGTGNDLLNGGDGDDVLNGGAGNDSLEGEAGDDVLVGGIGDDQLNGGAGNDTYRCNLGDGRDTVFDTGASTDTDTVLFGSGVTAGMLTLKADAGQILLRVGLGTDSLALGSTFDVAGSQTIERFQFADGTVLFFTDLVAAGFDITGTGGDDALVGTSVVDRFRGGVGNDRLEGGAGNDTYFFNVGDGVDTIVDTVSAGAGNEAVFGAGITSTDLRLDLVPDLSDSSRKDLLIHIGANGDALQLDSFDPNNVLGPRTVESFRFADGSTLMYGQLLARGFDLTGTDGVDRIIGTDVTDRITAGAGADVLKAGVGDDILDGGAGDDRLVGGRDNDTYVFGPGSGRDVIVESQGSLDRIQMAAGISPADVVVSRSQDDLVLTLTNGTDRLTIFSYFLAPSLQIEQVQFADGTVWDKAAIDNLLRPIITGTTGNDVIVGTSGDDRLLGLGGNDQLIGLAGHDVLDGGSGPDRLDGGLGDDRYLVDEVGDVVSESADEGIDTILSSVTHRLETNVENLTMTGVAAINGTGNTLDNILTGNSAANVLTGGLGNDTYVVGVGDTVVELVGEGTDTVVSNRDATLEANVENLTLTGSASSRGMGNELDNVLSADGSISVLVGGEGNDTYLIGPNADNDVLIETATGGIDTVIAFRGYRLPSNIENLTLLDSPIPDTGLVGGSVVIDPNASGMGIGNGLNNTLRGSRTANVLDGGAGADTLIGATGDDTYVVDNVGDHVIEQANEGLDTIRTSVSYVLPEHVENLILTGIGMINGTGNMGNNTILGNDAVNVLDGEAGNDLLNGGEGADTFLFGVGSGRDVVADMTQTGAVDTVQVAAELAPADLGVFQRGEDMVLSIAGTVDELVLENFYGPSEWSFKQVRFADGTLWNAEDLRTRAVAVGGTVIGTTSDDTLLGGLGHDVLVGDAGNDTLTGGQGNDFLYGDAQTNNPFFPVIGNDTLTGGLGDDVLRDFQGTNLFDGGPGNDTLYVGAGQDTVRFVRGSGSDFLTLDNNGSDLDIIQFASDIAPADVVLSRQYPDYNIINLFILDSGDTLTVTLSTLVELETPQAVVRFADGTQWMLVWSPPDLSFATGTVLDDVVSGSPGDVLRGLAGDDIYLIDAGSGSIVEQSNEGIDTVQSSVDYTLPANVEKLILAETNSSVVLNPVSGTGNELDNLIVGNSGDNILDGTDGNDVLIGGYVQEEEVGITQPGSDILIGGEGNDVLMSVGGVRSFAGRIEPITVLNPLFRIVFDDLLLGGVGDDTYILYSQQEMVVEVAGEGTDTVQAAVSYVLGENIENLTLIGTGSLNGTGNDQANVLIGNGDDNVLDGLEGDDTLWGGSALSLDSDIIISGNDTLLGGVGNDTYLFKLGDGIDTIDDVALPGEGNVVQFGEGIIRSSLSFSAGSVIIHVGTGGDALRLLHSTLTDPTGPHAVDLFRFADGTEVTYAELLGGAPADHTPTVTNPLVDRTVLEDAPLIVQVPANTFADQDVGDSLTYSATLANGTALPSWLSFNATTRTVTGTPDDAQVGTLSLKVTATDSGVLSVSSSFVLTVQNVNEAPMVVTPLIDQMVLEDAPLIIHVPVDAFADEDVGDALTYSATLANGNVLPSWLSFNAITRTFTGTPDDAQVGTLTLKVTATDSGGLSASSSVALSVQNVNEAPTVANPLVDQTVLEDAALSMTVPANAFADEDAGDTLTYSVSLANGTALPSWLSFDAATRMLTGLPDDAQVGALNLIVTATDSSGLSASSSFALTVQNLNEAPTVSSLIADQQVTQGAAFNFVLADNTFADVDVGDTLTYSATLANGTALPNWLSFNPITRTFSGTPGSGDVGVLGIRVRVTDQGNLTAFDLFDLRVNSLDQTLTGTAGNDVLTGGAGNDRLSGLAGADTLAGNAGNDLLDGGTGADTMRGGAGNDTYVVDNTGDVVTENLNEGTDTVKSSITHSLGAHIENLILTGTTPISGTGNALDNILTGNSANNILTGGAGNDTLNGGMGIDTLVGGAGNDIYVVDAVGDVVTELVNQGTDSVQSSVTFTLGANVENLMLMGTANTNGGGNSVNNVLIGNSGNNMLDGASGDDTIIGGAGNDLLVGGSGNDTLNGEDGVDTLNGGAGDDQLLGGAGSDVITGGSGDDQFTGGTDNDILIGNSGNDRYSFSRGDGQDTIIDADQFPGNQDRAVFGTTINPLDLVLSRQANDLRLAIHGSVDQVTVKDWYLSSINRIETIQAGNGQILLSTQVDQLIHAMASFTRQSGLSWDQAIDQRSQDVQAALAASWQ